MPPLPTPINWGHNVDDRCASVCPSLCPVPDPKSRMEGHRKLKDGRKEASDMGDL